LEKNNINFLLKIKEMDFLLAKFLYIIAKIINFSENYPKIYQVLSESFELFKAIKSLNLKQMSIYVLDAINYYLFVFGGFIEKNFIEIYPEFLTKFKISMEFLRELIDLVENEDFKIEIIKNIKFYIENFKKIKCNTIALNEGYDVFLI
jgi:hypothetical protein